MFSKLFHNPLIHLSLSIFQVSGSDILSNELLFKRLSNQLITIAINFLRQSTKQKRYEFFSQYLVNFSMGFHHAWVIYGHYGA